LGNELRFDPHPGGLGGTNIGGWGYEHQPYTKYWGAEYDYKTALNSGGATDSMTYAIIGAGWPARGVVNFFFPPDSLKLQLFHRNPLAGTKDVLQLVRINANSTETLIKEENLPGGSAWWGNWHNFKTWVDDDRNVRIYHDGALMLVAEIPSNVRPSLYYRAFNFLHGVQSQYGYLRNFRTYDRAHDLAWSLIFAETFNRANGAVDNGWSQLGSNAGIVNNSWSTTGTSDGGRALLRDTGITSGSCRIEGIIGGNIGVGSTQHSDLLLCANGTTGTQAIVVRLNNSTISIGRYSGSFTGTSPSFTEYRNFPYSPSNGDIVGAALKNGTIIVDLNGAYVGFAEGVHDVVPASNSWYGLRVKRQTFGNSFSWNDCNIFQAAA